MAASVVITGSDDVEAVDDQERVEPEPSDEQRDVPVDTDGDADDNDENSSGSDLPFPSFASKAFYVLNQTTAPRRWCLKLITSPYPFHQLFSL